MLPVGSGRALHNVKWSPAYHRNLDARLFQKVMRIYAFCQTFFQFLFIIIDGSFKAGRHRYFATIARRFDSISLQFRPPFSWRFSWWLHSKLPRLWSADHGLVYAAYGHVQASNTQHSLLIFTFSLLHFAIVSSPFLHPTFKSRSSIFTYHNRFIIGNG